MQRRSSPEGARRPITRVVVQERPATAQLVLEIGEPGAGRALPLVVAATHRDGEAMAWRHHDGSGPQLDVELNGLAGLQRLHLVVRVIRPVVGGELLIELAVRRAKPALSDRRMRIDRAREYDLAQVR